MQQTKEVFAQRLKEEMKEKGINQTDLAKVAGVKRQTISNYLNAERTADIDTLQMISKFLSVSSDYLIGNTDIKSSNTTIQDICNFTGLNELALNKLVEITHIPNDTNPDDPKTNRISFKDCVNLLLSNNNFDMLIIALKQYLNVLHGCEMLRQELSDRLTQYKIPITNINKQAAQICVNAITIPNNYDIEVVLCAKALVDFNTKLEYKEYMVQKSISKILSHYNKEGD